MTELDYEFLDNYFGKEIHRLNKIVAKATAGMDFNRKLYDTYREHGKKVQKYEQAIDHAQEVLMRVEPTVKKLQEQQQIIRDNYL